MQRTKKPPARGSGRFLEFDRDVPVTLFVELKDEVFGVAAAVFADGGDAVVAAGFGFVLLGLADDLAIAGFEDEVVLAVRGFFFLEVCFIGSVICDRSDAIFRSLSIGVALGLEDDFAVASFEAEVEFLGFVALEEFVHSCFEYSRQGEPKFARLSGESLPKFVEEDGRGGGDVEGVDLAGHGEVGEVVAEGFDFGAESEVFGLSLIHI